MRLNSKWLTVVTLAVGIGGLVAPNVAVAQLCTADNCPFCDVATITTIGKGQRSSVNDDTTSVITGRIVDLSSLGATAHRIPVCAGTQVDIVITNAGDAKGPTTVDLSGAADLSCDALTIPTGGGATCSGTINTKALYIVRGVGGGGSDTDRMTLLPVGEPGPEPPGPLGTDVCTLDSSGTVCSLTGAPCTDVFSSSDCLIPNDFCLAKSRIDVTNILTAPEPLSLGLFGSLSLTGGLPDPGTGKTVATCNVVELAPIDLGGLGTVCVLPSTTACPPGEVDCDGGNVLDIDLVADHNIGTCTGQSDCATQCDMHCVAPQVALTSGCEGFCTDGAQMPCTMDDQCAAAGQGSCSGGEGIAHGNICGCQCVDTMTGAASRPGGILCNLGANINLIALRGDCDTAPPTVVIGDSCLPVTSEGADNVIVNAQNTPGNVMGPDAQTGVPSDCAALAGGSCSASCQGGGDCCAGGARDGLTCATDADCDGLVPSGTTIVGGADFFDSTIGDLLVSIKATCGICGDGIRSPGSEQCDSDDAACPRMGSRCLPDCTCS